MEIKNKHKGMFLELDYGTDIKLDLKDKKILSILGENCRTPYSRIGKQINSGKDSIRYRIKELIKKDVYRGDITILNPLILGVPVYTILLKLKKIRLEKEEALISFFEKHPFIIWVGKTQGAYDFNVVMAARNIEHFDRILKEIEVKLKDHIKTLRVLNITKMYSCNTLPIEFQKEYIDKKRTEKIDSSFSLLLKEPYVDNKEDKTNLNFKEILVLKELSNNANLSFQELSEKTKITPDTIKNVIIRLIQKNIILVFRALINVSFLKYHGYVIYFKLSPDTINSRREAFERYFRNSMTLAFGTGASGSYYDVVTYIFSKNPLEFNELINEIRNKFSDIIEEYEADIILKDYKFTFFPEGLVSLTKGSIIKTGAKSSK